MITLRTAPRLIKELEELEAAYNLSPVGLCVLDRSLRFTRMNESFARIDGVPAQEHLGKTPGEVVPSGFSAGIESLARSVVERGEPLYDIEFSESTPSASGQARTWAAQMLPGKADDGLVQTVNIAVEDITKRKKAEEEWARLAAILESTSDLVAITRPGGQGAYMNTAGRRMLGLGSDADILKYNIKDAHPARAFRTVVDQGIPAAIAHGVWEGETAIVNREGRELPVSQVIMTHRSANGELEFLSTVVRDISEQKQAEEKLRASEANLREAQEIARMGRWELDLATGRLLWSEGIFALFEVSPEAFPASYEAFLEYVHPDDRALVDRAYRESVENRTPYDIEHRLLMKDGRVKWVSEICRTVYDDTGLPIRSVGTVQDITDRKRAEEGLRKSEARFRSYFEQNVFGLTVTSLEKGWIEANDRLCDILGYSRDELMRMTWAELTHPDDLRIDEAQFNRVISGEIDGYSMEKRYIRKDGKPIWASISVRCVRLPDGKPDYFIGIVQDITKRKNAEDELSRYRRSLEELVRSRTIELEEKNKKLLQEIAERKRAEGEKQKIEAQLIQTQRIEALDRFAGGIAHDLNNILYPIIINLEELLGEEPGDSNRRDMLSQTLKAAYRQRDLVKKILSFSRRSERIVQPVKLKPLLDETVDFLKSSLPSTIAIEQSIDTQADVIMGDPIQIQQVIMNLCQNAADALESRKGTIEVGLSKTFMKSLHGHQDIRSGDYLKLTVRDSGIGMKPELMDRIFEPFFTSKGIGKGTGMGLSVVHGIVRSHGGVVTVESEEGKGSLFTVYLPVSDTDFRAQAPHAVSAAEVQARKSILLVDDEEILLSSLARSLRQSGYQVDSFQDGPKALQRFMENPDGFDLVITDLTMPGMTGLELSRKILGIRPGIPIILSTGYNDLIGREEARTLGIRELIIKPTGVRELKSIIGRALEGKSG